MLMVVRRYCCVTPAWGSGKLLLICNNINGRLNVGDGGGAPGRVCRRCQSAPSPDDTHRSRNRNNNNNSRSRCTGG